MIKLHKLYRKGNNDSFHFPWKIVNDRLDLFFYSQLKYSWEYIKDANNHPTAWQEEDIVSWDEVELRGKREFLKFLWEMK